MKTFEGENSRKFQGLSLFGKVSPQKLGENSHKFQGLSLFGKFLHKNWGRGVLVPQLAAPVITDNESFLLQKFYVVAVV